MKIIFTKLITKKNVSSKYLLLLFLEQLDFPNYNSPFYFIFTINYKEI